MFVLMGCSSNAYKRVFEILILAFICPIRPAHTTNYMDLVIECLNSILDFPLNLHLHTSHNLYLNFIISFAWLYLIECVTIFSFQLLDEPKWFLNFLCRLRFMSYEKWECFLCDFGWLIGWGLNFMLWDFYKRVA